MAYFTYKLENNFTVNLTYEEFRVVNDMVGAAIDNTKPEDQVLFWHDKIIEREIRKYLDDKS
jgi:hypothetical protein